MDEKNTAQLFMQLVIQNQQMAMTSLGKCVGKNLEYSKLSIDIVDAILQESKSNFFL